MINEKMENVLFFLYFFFWLPVACSTNYLIKITLNWNRSKKKMLLKVVYNDRIVNCVNRSRKIYYGWLKMLMGMYV